MIVVDASVAVTALLNDGDARRMLGDSALAAPHLVDAEVLHTLRRLLNRGQMSAEEAELAVLRWRLLGVQRFPLIGLVPRIWALRDNLSAYGAAYTALAEALDCPLVTTDARLAAAPGPQCPITVLPA
ncbi:MAG: type II toxin-antitoxin system VapC family toxin [bacterium]|nr:type II toxin-antitoxin system VapC family toxin [bacterium]